MMSMSIDTTTSENNLYYIVKLEKYIWTIPCHSAYVLLDRSSTEIGTCSLGDIYMIVCNTIVINNKNNPNVNWQGNIPVQISELQIYRTWIMNRGIGLFSKCTILKTTWDMVLFFCNAQKQVKQKRIEYIFYII